jgi:hypothetical protein
MTKDRYAVSKLFNLFFAREIAVLPQAEGVVVKYASVYLPRTVS